MNINELLDKLNDDQKKTITELLSSAKGKSVAGNLSDNDKKAIIDKIRQLDTDKIKAKLDMLSPEAIKKLFGGYHG